MEKVLHCINDALEILEMKTIHMMTLCPTRLSYLLSACAQTVDQLVAIYDVLATAGIKKDGKGLFHVPEGYDNNAFA